VQGNLAPRFIDPFNITEEREEELKTSFQHSFLIRSNLGDEIHFNGGRFVTPKISNFGM
jgi:hypothetical protein